MCSVKVIYHEFLIRYHTNDTNFYTFCFGYSLLYLYNLIVLLWSEFVSRVTRWRLLTAHDERAPLGHQGSIWLVLHVAHLGGSAGMLPSHFENSLTTHVTHGTHRTRGIFITTHGTPLHPLITYPRVPDFSPISCADLSQDRVEFFVYATR